MKRTPLKRIGKIGEANLKANKILKQLFLDKGIDYCEIGLPRCVKTWTLANVHRHKRMWYKSNLELLYDFKQVVRGCTPCHETIENDKELTEAIFLKLRGPE